MDKMIRSNATHNVGFADPSRCGTHSFTDEVSFTIRTANSFTPRLRLSSIPHSPQHPKKSVIFRGTPTRLSLRSAVKFASQVKLTPSVKFLRTASK